ncbi:OmpP1/FadL family transporter [candidate division KSB1 bacterium]
MKKILLILLVFLLVYPGFGQSIYSIPGFGELNYNNNVRVKGMGGLGISVEDDISISAFNPASIISLKNTSIFIGGIHSRSVSKYQSADFGMSFTRFTGLGFGVRAADNFAFSLSINPFSNLNYALKLKEANGATKSLSGDGGINLFSFSGAYKMRNIITIGASVNYYFGNIDEKYRIDFLDNSFLNTERSVYSSMKGASFSGGIILKLSEKLNFGFTFKPSVTLNGEQGIRFFEDSVGYQSNFKFKLPSSYGFGLFSKLNRKISVNIDLYKNLYKDSKIDGSPVQYFNDSNHFGLGFEYIDSDDPTDPLKRRIAYRVGLNMGNFYINDLNNNKVNEFLITTGMGIPFMEGKGRIDMAFQFGKRGNTSLNPGQDLMFKFFISIAGGEKWFVERTF